MSCLALGLAVAACGSGPAQPLPGPDADLPDVPDAEQPEPGPDAATDPNEPPPGFLEPTSANYVIVEFKGLINTYDTYVNDYSNLITGTGRIVIGIGGKTVQISTSDGMFCSEYSFPDDYPVESQRGRHIIDIDAYHMSDDSTASKGTLTGIVLSFASADLMALGADEHLISTMGATVYEEAFVIRKDSSSVVRICYRALETDGSYAFVDHSANKTFAPGENLIVWANAVEETDPAVIAQILGTEVTSYQGQPCACYVDSVALDCADYDVEAAKDGTELSCNPPRDFLNPPAGDYATFTFKGLISSGDDLSPPPAFVLSTVSVGGKQVPLNVSGYAFAWYDSLTLQAYGEQTGDAKKFSMDMLSFTFPTDLLSGAKNSGTNPIVVDAAAGVSALASTLTGYSSGKDYVYRICPYAVFRAGETAGSLYDCPAANTSFAVGEKLEIQGNFVLGTSITEADVGTPLDKDGCYCLHGTTNEVLDCSTLPQP